MAVISDGFVVGEYARNAVYLGEWPRTTWAIGRVRFRRVQSCLIKSPPRTLWFNFYRIYRHKKKKLNKTIFLGSTAPRLSLLINVGTNLYSCVIYLVKTIRFYSGRHQYVMHEWRFGVINGFRLFISIRNTIQLIVTNGSQLKYISGW